EWEYGFIIKFRAEKCIISVYNNINMSILEPKLKELLEISMCEFDSIIICGDMNARVGSAQMCNGMDECECRVQSRRTQDESINENGKKLIKIGEEMGLMLLNGRCKGDEEGKITYVGCDKQSKGSVLDLVMIVDRGDEDIVKRLCVVTRTESDHLPVTFELGAIMEKEQSIEFLRWTVHFSTLLNKNVEEKEKKRSNVEQWSSSEGIHSTDDNLDKDIEIDEIKDALKRMPNGKATGEDGVPIECIKVIARENMVWIADALNKIWSEGKLPSGWEKAWIVPIFKGGDNAKTENYRGISLLDVGYKVLTVILADRIGRWVENNNILNESQAGFRRKRGTRDHIFVLNSLINGRLRRKRGKLYVGFIDFKAAFDTIDREL
ncbi:GSCOCG00012752001-RA-CDS, partial [Cotesia congregata]